VKRPTFDRHQTTTNVRFEHRTALGSGSTVIARIGLLVLTQRTHSLRIALGLVSFVVLVNIFETSTESFVPLQRGRVFPTLITYSCCA
jgi:hypothetical protein